MNRKLSDFRHPADHLRFVSDHECSRVSEKCCLLSSSHSQLGGCGHRYGGQVGITEGSDEARQGKDLEGASKEVIPIADHLT